MPSDFLSPFVELDDALCKTFLNLRVDDDRSPARKAPPGYQRTFSACPVISSGSCFSSSEHLEDVAAADPLWPPHGHWRPDAELPHTSLQRIPFQGDRSVSMIEDGRGAGGEGKAPSSRYKTELCRTFEESGTCKSDSIQIGS
uniref:Uncharacterized protein n=1 Tax=Sphenodon punctatus TaxID=8508 RepID=A0A8D0GWE3_SPHPU